MSYSSCLLFVPHKGAVEDTCFLEGLGMSCVSRRFGGLQEEQCLGKTGLQHSAVKAVQNCLNPGFSYLRVNLEAVDMKTNCTDSSSMYPSESSSTCVGLWAKLSYGSAQRSQLAVLLCPWLASRELGMQGRPECAIPLNKMSSFILENTEHP